MRLGGTITGVGPELLPKKLLKERWYLIRSPLLHFGAVGSLYYLGSGNVNDVGKDAFHDRSKTSLAGSFCRIGHLHGNMNARRKKLLAGASYAPTCQANDNNKCTGEKFGFSPKTLQIHSFSLYANRTLTRRLSHAGSALFI